MLDKLVFRGRGLVRFRFDFCQEYIIISLIYSCLHCIRSHFFLLFFFSVVNWLVESFPFIYYKIPVGFSLNDFRGHGWYSLLSYLGFYKCHLVIMPLINRILTERQRLLSDVLCPVRSSHVTVSTCGLVLISCVVSLFCEWKSFQADVEKLTLVTFYGEFNNFLKILWFLDDNTV